MPLIELTPPANEPLTMAELKLALKLEHDDDDITLETCLNAARLALEKRYDMAFVSRNYRLTLHRWPGRLKLPIYPSTAILSVKVTNLDGSQTTLAPATYLLSNDRLLFYAYPPEPGVAFDGIEIEFSAGTGATGEIKQAVQMLAIHFYENRGVSGNSTQLPENITSLMAHFRKVRI